MMSMIEKDIAWVDIWNATMESLEYGVFELLEQGLYERGMIHLRQTLNCNKNIWQIIIVRSHSHIDNSPHYLAIPLLPRE